VVADVCGSAWPVSCPFDVWHDRAVFHFLSEPEQVQAYVRRVRECVRPGGHLVIATFGPDGPEQCSGLQVQRYDAAGLAAPFRLAGFTAVESFREVHNTPWGAEQPFVYVVLRAAGESP
jgi:hypothetical protein